MASKSKKKILAPLPNPGYAPTHYTTTTTTNNNNNNKNNNNNNIFGLTTSI